MLIHGSLLPFDINPSVLTFANRLGLFQISCHYGNFEDALVNLLIYVPLGVFLTAGVVIRRRSSVLVPARILLATGFAAILSVAVESIQTASPSRVGSWIDVILNTVGAGVGATLALALGARVRSMIGRLARSLADRTFSTAASVLTLCLFAYHLAPFDFVTTTPELHASFSRARIAPSSITELFNGSGAGTVSEWQSAAWFLVLGYLLALSGREIGRRSAGALVSAWKHGMGLAGLIELLQLFTQSHAFEASSVVLRAIGVFVGAWLALFLVEIDWSSTRREKTNSALPTTVLATSIGLQALLLFLPALSMSSWSLHAPAWNDLRIIPFEALWRASAATAAMDVVGKLITFGSLFITLAILLRRSGVETAGFVAGTCVILLVGAFELLRCVTAGHAVDGTVLAIAALSGYPVWKIEQFVRLAGDPSHKHPSTARGTL